MLKVIIVDDEQFIAQGLQALIDWNAAGYEVAAVLSDGQEALEYIKKLPVDLVITDVMMPKMTGLELLETVRRENLSNAGFVILSGYSEFSYAQKALRYGCIDYLLKPVEKQDLLSILSKYNNISQNSKMEEQYELAYQARCLISLLFGKYDPNGVDYLHKHLDFSGGVRYIEISACHSSDNEDDDDENHFRMVQRDLYQSCVQILGEDRSRCFCDASLDRVGYGIAFVYSGALARNAGCSETQYIQDFYKKLGVSTQHELRFLVGKKVDDITTVSESYDTVCGLKNLCAFRQPKSIYYYEEELSVPQERAVLCKDTLDQLITAIKLNEQERIGSEIDHLFAEMQQRGVHDKDINLNLNYLLFRLMHLASNLDNEANQKEMLQFISAQSFREGISRGSRQHLFRFAREYADYLSLLRKNISIDILDSIDKEIQEHYSENLTLQGLGKKYYINSAYLGQIFRKKYGQSFKNYLCSYRINEACRQLLYTNKQIGRIAEDVGYKDVDYFLCKFIELKGCTPSHFRKSKTEKPHSEFPGK
jgi:two-component system response regulator YesN